MVLVVAVIGIFVTTAMPIEAQSGTQTLLADSLSHQSGSIGSGQSVTNLHANDQTGGADEWSKYVEFLSTGPLYQGYRSYTLPSNIDPSTITSLQVQANYRGPATAGQIWTWSLYNWSSQSWVPVGDNSGAPWWGNWQMLTFDGAGTLADFVDSSTREIRVQVQANNTTDNMDLDYETVLVSHTGAGSTTTVTYQPTTTLFPNPERGFYRYFKSVSRLNAPNSRAEWLVADLTSTNSVSWLSAAEETTITQIYCYFLLDEFLTSAIDVDFLQLIRTNLDNVREAGKKCILRFSYSEPVDDDDPEYSMRSSTSVLLAQDLADATLSQILLHVQQLESESIFDDYADIISVLQAGFIGVWGEWYYTDHFVDPGSQMWQITDPRYADRRQVVDALLAALPAERMIAVRYPKAKRKMYDYALEDSITDGEAYQNTPKARIGFHNDALLNTYGDSGTYQDANDRPYMEVETVYLTMGGEVNEFDDDDDLEPHEEARPRTCASVINEMELYHWSYINTDYDIDTLANWQNDGCIHDTAAISNSMLDRLGYRFKLQQATLPNGADRGSSAQIQIDLVNEGFAAPYNPRDVYVVLRNQTTGANHPFPLSVDPRMWLADGQTHQIDEAIALPADLPVGQYDLYLQLPDQNSTLAADARYAIRLANAGLWNNGSWDGYNALLHSMEIRESISGPPTDMAQQLQPSGSTNQTSPAFLWQRVNFATHYRVVVYDVVGQTIVTDEIFDSNSVCGVTDCAATFAVSLYPGSFTWLIQAQNSYGNGPWSILP